MSPFELHELHVDMQSNSSFHQGLLRVMFWFAVMMIFMVIWLTIVVSMQAFFITNMEPIKFWEFMSLILEGLGYER